ncbi:hypothetical protein C8Q80DRAFT_619968 [Daedaleopsis nitida]|nr:hypothetical protein C8Q80DRAFT_619968 [Daedaleopsis nitida]
MPTSQGARDAHQTPLYSIWPSRPPDARPNASLPFWAPPATAQRGHCRGGSGRIRAPLVLHFCQRLSTLSSCKLKRSVHVGLHRRYSMFFLMRICAHTQPSAKVRHSRSSRVPMPLLDQNRPPETQPSHQLPEELFLGASCRVCFLLLLTFPSPVWLPDLCGSSIHSRLARKSIV